MMSTIHKMFQPKKIRKIPNPYCSLWKHTIMPKIQPKTGMSEINNEGINPKPK